MVVRVVVVDGALVVEVAEDRRVVLLVAAVTLGLGVVLEDPSPLFFLLQITFLV